MKGIEPGGKFQEGKQHFRNVGEHAAEMGKALAGHEAVHIFKERLQFGAALAGDVLEVAETRQRAAGEIRGAPVDFIRHWQHPFQ